MTAQRLTRPLSEVARDIGNDWHAMRQARTVGPRGIGGPHPAQRVYMVMRTLHTSDLAEHDHVGADAVRWFLANSKGWRGADAARIKAELRDALAHHDVEHHEPADILY